MLRSFRFIDRPCRCLARPVLPLLLAAAGPALADRVVLKNGHTVEGRVERETAESVTLRLDSGTADFRRAQIASVIRDSADRNAAIESAWRDKNFLKRPYVPAGQEALAARFLALDGQRRLAADAQQALEQADRSADGRAQKLATLRDAYLSASARLQTASPSNNIPAYNALVASNNASSAALELHRGELERERDARAARIRAVSDYLAALQAAAAAVTTARDRLAAAAAPDPAETAFVEKLIARLKSCEDEFKPLDAKSRLHGNSTVVAALVNGRAWGQFIVDTGAEIATLSRAFAERAGIAPDVGEKIDLRLADGSPVSGRLVRLEGVRIGDVDQFQIEAAILPFPPDPELDGLLGMNVLRTFHIRMDRATGLLQLDRFAPR